MNCDRVFGICPEIVALTLLLQSPIFCKKVVTRMLGAQSYIVRLLRMVETGLNEQSHLSEASRVGKIVQKLAQAEDIRSAIGELYAVERFDQFALKLMWFLEQAEHSPVNTENTIMEHQSSELATLVLSSSSGNAQAELASSGPSLLPDQIDDVYLGLHKFGRAIEELKRNSFSGGLFQGIQEQWLYGVLNELVSLKASAVTGGKEDVAKFADACTEFVQHAVENVIVQDVRVVNVLDSANTTLQTVFEAGGNDDNESLQSTIKLLKQPGDLLD